MSNIVSDLEMENHWYAHIPKDQRRLTKRIICPMCGDTNNRVVAYYASDKTWRIAYHCKATDGMPCDAIGSSRGGV